LTDCVLEKGDSSTVIHLKNNEPQDLWVNFIIGHSGRFLDPLKSDEKSNGDIIWGKSSTDVYVDSILECGFYGCHCDGNSKKDNTKCKVKNENLFKDGKLDETVYATLKKTMLDKIKAIKHNFGYAHVTFTAEKAVVEFRENNADPQAAIKYQVAKRFTLDRKITPSKVHKINLMVNKEDNTFDFHKLDLLKYVDLKAEMGKAMLSKVKISEKKMIADKKAAEKVAADKVAADKVAAKHEADKKATPVKAKK
jgi:hypothetical protein